MLRIALPRGRWIIAKPAHSHRTRQWVPHTPIQGALFGRTYADVNKPDGNTKPSIKNSEAAILPGSQSETATAPAPLPPGPVAPLITPNPDSTILVQNIPLTPPPPPPEQPASKFSLASAPPSSSQSTLPSPPPKKPRRFRRFLLYLFALSTLSYAGGVWFSLRSDNFHDFFTEYIPFGEDAVFYFEEREFRRRFPNATKPTNRPVIRDTSPKVTIPSKSGLSWKVSEEDSGSDLASKGPHMSALGANKPGSEKAGVQTAQRTPGQAAAGEKTQAVDAAKKSAPPAKKDPEKKKTYPPSSPRESPPTAKSETPKPASSRTTSVPASSAKTARDPKKDPEVDEPSVYIPPKPITPLGYTGNEDPVVADVFRTLNDIITVINADGSQGKYSSTIEKAKTELGDVGKRILQLKKAEQENADAKIKATQADFETAATELVRRLEAEMQNQGAQWKEEFESEREKISQSYQDRLGSEVSRLQQISDLSVRNQLLEQAVSLKKQFLADVKDRVETERDGRLAKLSELSSSVSELEKLTAEWNSVIDANLRTQHLHVAIDAVRTSLERTDRPRPFTKELAALKEVASGDALVNGAIASINPTAYQRGVAAPAQLIDRFRRVAAEVRKASLLPEDAGVASHAASLFLSRFLFRKQGLAMGDDVESVLTRTEMLLEEGALDDAAREMNSLSGWAKTLSADWLGEVRRVLEVRQALDVISTEARLQSLKVD